MIPVVPPRNAKTTIRTLSTTESLPMLQHQLMLEHKVSSEDPGDQRRDSVTSNYIRHDSAPLALSVAVKRDRLVVLGLAMVAAIAALTLAFGGRGVVLERFDRDAVSIQQQEELLERYNSYSGTVTSALERPLAWFLQHVVPVVVLRLLTTHALAIEPNWRMTGIVMAAGTATAYFLGNGLSAVNVQVRELPVQLRIVPADLLPTLELGNATNMSVSVSTDESMTMTTTTSWPELQEQNPMANTLLRNLGFPQNPMANTLLRNLGFPRKMESHRDCRLGTGLVGGEDEVAFRFSQQSWMKDLVPHARKTTNSLRLAISPDSPVVPAPLDQFPMNASVAADLLVYGLRVSAWGNASWFPLDDRPNQLFREADSTATQFNVPIARLTSLLPSSLKTTEQQDREWFWRNAGPAMYNRSLATNKNSSLRSWNMTFSHIDIEPGVVWVNAVTVEREVASPRFESVAATPGDDSTRYYNLPYNATDFATPSVIKLIPKAPGAVDQRIAVSDSSIDERIDAYRICTNGTDQNQDDVLLGIIYRTNKTYVNQLCYAVSSNALLVVGYGRRLVADKVIENATMNGSQLVPRQGFGVVVNLREIVSVTVARISWKVQDLAARYHAKCDVPEGCQGLDVALPGSGRRVVLSANAIALEIAPWPFAAYVPLSIVSIQRPQRYVYVTTDLPAFVGDLLLPHNVRDRPELTAMSRSRKLYYDLCVGKPLIRLANVVNNHMYMEHTLQPTYTAAALFLLQAGVARDVLNQSWTSDHMLAFQGNSQDVDVYDYIPSLNVALTLLGCALVGGAILTVVLWSHLGWGGPTDPLANITTPHAIARVLLDNTAFPAALLTRSVAPADATADNASDFQIQTLSLGSKDESTNRV